MAMPNEVRFNVRHNVLLLKIFTVPQLRAITGLNRQSIHTELRRMEAEELVFRTGVGEKKKHSSGGRPPVIYQITSDPKKRVELLQSVRAFYTAAQEQASELPRPESKHYFIAKQKLEDVIERGADLTEAEKASSLDSIKERLQYARQEEEVGEEGTQLIGASLDILEAQAIDILAGDWKSAVKLLDDTRKTCQQVGADDLIAEVHSYVQTIVGRITKELVESFDNRMYQEAEQAAENLRIIEYSFGDLPWLRIVIEPATSIARTARQMSITARVEEDVERQIETAIQALNARLRTVIETTWMGAPIYADSVAEADIGMRFALRSFLRARATPTPTATPTPNPPHLRGGARQQSEPSFKHADSLSEKVVLA